MQLSPELLSMLVGPLAGSEGRSQRGRSAPRMSLDSQKSDTAAVLASPSGGKGSVLRTRSLQVCAMPHVTDGIR